MKRQLSQQEIDSLFQTGAAKDGAAESTVSFDFKRLDRIPKAQLSAIHHLHETFVRTFGTSLSAYLRSFVTGSLISVEQLPFSEFAEGLQSPTCIMYLSMLPYEGHTFVELTPALIAPILELILGSTGKLQTALDREMTEVEKDLIESFFHVLAQDLRETWKPVAAIGFGFTPIETKPQMSGRFAPAEAVVALGIELRIGETAGMINIAIPSITLKMMGQRFDQQWTSHKTSDPAVEQAIKERLLKALRVSVDCELRETIRLRDLLELAPGQIFKRGAELGPLDILVNGFPRFKAIVAQEQHKRVAMLQ